MPAATKLRRRALINLVLKDLREFRNSCGTELTYAVDENTKFFEAAKHLWKYIPWLLGRYPSIEGKRIKTYSKIVSEECRKRSIVFLDITQEWAELDCLDFLSDDGIHPNEKGHQKIFEKIKSLFI